MSCLYSSPEVTSVELLAVKLIALKLQALNYRRRRPVRPGTRLTCDLIAVQFDPTQILPCVAVTQDAFPISPADAAGCFKSFRLPKQAQVFYRGFSSAISVF